LLRYFAIRICGLRTPALISPLGIITDFFIQKAVVVTGDEKGMDPAGVKMPVERL